MWRNRNERSLLVLWKACDKRKQVDERLAEADPEDFTPAMRVGVACAMNADIRKTYWGKACQEEWNQQKRKDYGCVKPEQIINEDMKELGRNLDEMEGAQQITAREIMKELTNTGDDDEIVKPKIEQRVDEEAPEEPNAYSDGSLKNVIGPFCPLGGRGVVAGKRRDTK